MVLNYYTRRNRLLSCCKSSILILLTFLIDGQFCYGYISPSQRRFNVVVFNTKEKKRLPLKHSQSPSSLLTSTTTTTTTSLSMTTTTMMVPAILLVSSNNNNINTMYRLGGIVGMIGLLCQCGLTKLLQRYTLTKDNAGYTAHTVVALVFMIYVSIVGSIGWYQSIGNGSTPSMFLFTTLTPFDRLILPNIHCQQLATIVTGLLIVWDLPTSILLRSLRKIDVILHHIIMTITSYFAATILPMYYLYFYFGVSEISSIPLLLYDQLCVWTKDTAKDNKDDGKSNITSNSIHNITSLTQWRDRIQIVAAIAFTLIRAILFTYVTVRYFIPDTISILNTAIYQSIRPIQIQALRFALYASIGFTSLQLYWFTKMLRTIYKQVITSSK